MTTHPGEQAPDERPPGDDSRGEVIPGEVVPDPPVGAGPTPGSPPADAPPVDEPEPFWGRFEAGGRGPEFEHQWGPPAAPAPVGGEPTGWPPPPGGVAHSGYAAGQLGAGGYGAGGYGAGGYGAGGPAGRRPGRGSTVGRLLVLAVLLAVLVGGAAGYGGFLLADATRGGSATGPATGASPSVHPTDPGTSGSASPLPAAPAQADTVEVARRVVPGTVMLEVGQSTGSGFLLDTAGRIMTNNHVVADAADGARIRVVFSDGRRSTAKLLGRSPSYDLAVVQVAASDRLQPLPLGRSDDAEVGQPVVAVGAPLGLPGTVTQGILSAVHRPVTVGGGSGTEAPSAYIDALQTDAPINPGNSGGPLVDAAGRVIGVNSAILTLGSGQGQAGNIGLGFAIPIDQAQVIGEQIVAEGRATYPVIGATVEARGSGVALSSVEADGPADDAGLRPGDVVTAVDGRRVRTPEELIVTVRTRRPGQQITLDYTRGAAERSVAVTLGSKEG